MSNRENHALRTEVLQLAWPILVSGFLGTIIMFTDRLILGRYSADTLAAMQVIGPVTWSTFSLFGSFAIGFLAVMGRAAGAKDMDRSKGVLSAAVLFGLIAGIVLGFVGFMARAQLTDWLLGAGAGDSVVREMSVTYLAWTFSCAPFLTVGVILTHTFQASGDTQTPMWLSLLGGVVNLAISYVFVFGAFGAPELGITGAAMGTAASAALNCILAFILIQRPHRELRIGKPRFEMLRPVVKVAVPAFGERGIFHVGFLIFAGMVGHLGNNAMAAHQACMAIESLGFIAAYALGSASGTIVAQKLGAEDPDAAKKAAIFTARFSFCLMTVIGLIFYIFAEQLVSWFCTDPETIELGAMCMRIAAIAQPIMALVDAFAGTLRGAGDTRSPMVAALAGPVCMRLLACWFFAFEMDLGLIGIWLGSTLDWFIRLIWLAIIFSRGKWLEIKL